MSSLPELARLHCRPLGPGAALSPAEVADRLAQVDGWTLVDGSISQRFTFSDFHHTMAFVNAVAWIAHQQDHHPDLQVGYGGCTVAFRTHSAGGLTLNDFVCASRIDALRDRAAA
jgi:4a-hydroxytetrahydrobiopterin dehydratase